MSGDDVFRQIAQKKSLKEATITKLLEQEYDSVPAIATLTEYSIAEMELSKPQSALLLKWVQEAQSCPDANISEQQAPVDARPKTTARLVTLPGLHTDGGNDGHVTRSQSLGSAVGYARPLPAPSTSTCREGTPQNPTKRKRPEGTEEFMKRMKMSTDSAQKIPVTDLVGIIDKGANDFMATEVNIAIIGRSGVGKSTLINGILSLRPGEEGAADVGSVETTGQVKPYKNPEMPRVVMWDLPGVGTRKFPKESYLTDVSFSSFDAFVIVCSNRIFEEDTWLAMNAKNLDKPFYFVRSKIDQDIENEARDKNLSPEAALVLIRENAQDSLVQNNIINDKIYLVSGRLDYQTGWDFPLLMQQLIEHTPEKNTAALVMAMVSCSKEIITQKKKYFSSRINTIAEQAANSGSSLLHIVSTEMELYMDRFGVSESSLDKFQIDMTKLNGKLQDIERGLREAVSKLESKKSDKKGVVHSIAKWKIFSGFGWAKAIVNAADEPFDVKVRNAEIAAQETKVKEMETTASSALKCALDQCEQLVLGVLEMRQNMATNGFMARVGATGRKALNGVKSFFGRIVGN